MCDTRENGTLEKQFDMFGLRKTKGHGMERQVSENLEIERQEPEGFEMEEQSSEGSVGSETRGPTFKIRKLKTGGWKIKSMELAHELKTITLKKMIKLDYARNEAYKSLRTNVRFCGNDIKAILMTSCVPNEGKSTVSFNLAKSLADDGKKVLFLDADLRKSVLIARLGASEDNREQILGLSHYLTGQNGLEEVVYESNIKNLYFIFSGPEVPNPTELLGNNYFDMLMEVARVQFDYIVVDAPPLGSVVDAAIMTKNCDGAIIVIENNAVSRRMAQTIRKQLEQTGIKILGAVLNKVDVRKGSYYQGYYHGYGYYKKAYKKYGDYGSYGNYGKY